MSKKVWVKILIILAIIIIAVLSVIMIGYFKVSSVNVDIIYPNNQVVVEKHDLNAQLAKEFGDFTQYSRNQIDNQKIKSFILKNKFIQKVVVNLTITGQLRITVYQRQIIARYYKGQKSYYLSMDKQIIDALKENNVAKCPILIGKMDNQQLYDIASQISNDDILRDNISSIIVKGKQVQLTPSQGKYCILLGPQKTWSEQLEKLSALIKYVFIENGWDDYQTIDLKYHNQVVCSKAVKQHKLKEDNK